MQSVKSTIRIKAPSVEKQIGLPYTYRADTHRPYFYFRHGEDDGLYESPEGFRQSQTAGELSADPRFIDYFQEPYAYTPHNKAYFTDVQSIPKQRLHLIRRRIGRGGRLIYDRRLDRDQQKLVLQQMNALQRDRWKFDDDFDSDEDALDNHPRFTCLQCG